MLDFYMNTIEKTKVSSKEPGFLIITRQKGFLTVIFLYIIDKINSHFI